MRRSVPSMFFRTGPILRSRRSPSRSRRTLGVEASGSPAVSVGKRSVISSLVGCFTCPPPPASGIGRVGALRTVALAFQANTPEAWMATLRSVLLSKATSCPLLDQGGPVTDVARVETLQAESPKQAPNGPRNARNHRSILDATMELLAEVGYAGLTMEGVAARAGV